MASDIEVRPLTRSRWADVEAVFGARGCGQARGCWCMHYRHSGAPPPRPRGVSLGDVYRRELAALADADPPAGLIGYRGDVPVGWISLGPREDFARLTRSPIMKPVDDVPVWSIVCFVVPPAFRRQGVARALLAGAMDFARRRGVDWLEAYPVDRRGEQHDDHLWWGNKSMYDEAGFVEVARRKRTRPVVRLALGKAGGRHR